MSNCGDLCTAAKCEELERRIEALEQGIELLEASFEAHTSQDIPEAHNFRPALDVDVSILGNRIFVSVTIDNNSRFDSAVLPDSHVESNLRLDGSFQNDVLTLTVADGESFDTATIQIPLPELRDPHVESNLSISASFYQEVLTISVADGESGDTAQVTIPIPEAIQGEQGIQGIQGERGERGFSGLQGERGFRGPQGERGEPGQNAEHVRSNLKINGIFQQQTLTLTVADGESSDTTQIQIPLPEIEEHVRSNLKINGIFQSETLTLTVADGESSDTAQIVIPIDDMNCDNLERKFDECCLDLTNLINNKFFNLSNELTQLENAINNEVKEVYDTVTIDISRSADTNYKCEFPANDNGDLIETYAESKTQSIDYSGKGLIGIHENLKIINTNLSAMYADICKAIDPISTIEIGDLYRYCSTDDSNINYSDYFNELGNEKFTGAKQQYQTAIDDYLTDLIKDSKYEYLLDSANANELITAPNSYITKMLADFALIQGKINNAAICDIEIPDDPEVVSIVASDKVVKRASGKFLVLHFVTLDNYPKRARNSTYWPTQIPAAMAEDKYSWCKHFDKLRWLRGNCYAELKFNEFSNPVSGFFKDKDAANSYFNAVLKLTTATEKNRIYHEHKDPQTNIIERVTRPYRAFIESVNSAGQATCHVKFVPPIEPCQ